MVDAETELPMPWCDAKWRYDAGGEASEVGSYKPSHENEVLTLISYEPEPEAEEEVGLVPSAARKSLPKDTRVRAIPRGRFVLARIQPPEMQLRHNASPQAGCSTSSSTYWSATAPRATPRGAQSASVSWRP